MTLNKIIEVSLITVLLACTMALTAEAADGTEATICFFDAGEGDSILISIDGKNVLIDGGPESAGSTILDYLASASISHLDFIVATHAHDDHIGGLIAVLGSTVTVDTVLYNGYNYTSQTSQEFLNLARQHNLTVTERNDVYFLSAAANFTILSPTRPFEFGGMDLNVNCIVLKFQVSNVSFLFASDTTAEAEQSMLNAGLDVGSAVFKVVYHGTRTGTSQVFLDAVNPTYAIISTDMNSTDGPFHEENVQRLIEKGVITYATYASGTIVFTTDGHTVAIQGSPEPIPESLSMLTLSLIAVTFLISMNYNRKHRRPI